MIKKKITSAPESLEFNKVYNLYKKVGFDREKLERVMELV